MTFFEQTSRRLNLRGNGALTWRKPQLGAIGALLQSFSLDDEEPPLISIPTGTGKTAVAMIAPHLMSPSPRRVLIVEPSVELRHQIAEEAEGQRVLRELGCIPTDADRPSVLELKGRVKEWSDVVDADFVVSHPQSISPSHYEASPPPNDLFDLVIVDEAHHLGAPTWRAILDYFKDARVILLTATPFRRDQKRIPGRLAYHYPLRSAISEGIYNPVIPDLLPVATGEARASVDARIAARAAEHLASTEHENSTMLIRGSTVERAKELAELYRVLGIHAEILHSRLEKRKAAIIDRSGEARAVADPPQSPWRETSTVALARNARRRSSRGSVRVKLGLSQLSGCLVRDSTFRDCASLPITTSTVRLNQLSDQEVLDCDGSARTHPRTSPAARTQSGDSLKLS